jgi:hypothetical protein
MLTHACEETCETSAAAPWHRISVARSSIITAVIVALVTALASNGFPADARRDGYSYPGGEGCGQAPPAKPFVRLSTARDPGGDRSLVLPDGSITQVLHQRLLAICH